MLLENLTKSANKKLKKVNKLLKEQYGFIISKNISSAGLAESINLVNERVYELKIGGKNARDCPELSKNIVMLEGLKIIAEDIADQGLDTYSMQGPYEKVIKWLAEFIADNVEVGDKFEDACAHAMKEYRSSQWRFPDHQCEQGARQKAIELLRSKENQYLLGEGCNSPLDEIEEEIDNWDRGQRAGLDKDYDEILSRVQQFHRDRGVSDKPPSVGHTDDNYQSVLDRVKQFHASKNMNEGKITEMKQDYVKRLRALLENDVDQAESMVGAKSLSGDLQEMIEKIGRLQNETLPKLTDQMRDAYGDRSAASFQQSTSGALQDVMDSLYQSRGQIDHSVTLMAQGGEGATDMDMAPEFGMDDEFGGEPGMDDEFGGEPGMDGEPSLDDELDSIEDEFGGAGMDEPLGRPAKESIRVTKRKIAEMQRMVSRARKIKEAQKRR